MITHALPVLIIGFVLSTFVFAQESTKSPSKRVAQPKPEQGCELLEQEMTKICKQEQEFKKFRDEDKKSSKEEEPLHDPEAFLERKTPIRSGKRGPVIDEVRGEFVVHATIQNTKLPTSPQSKPSTASPSEKVLGQARQRPFGSRKDSRGLIPEQRQNIGFNCNPDGTVAKRYIPRRLEVTDLTTFDRSVSCITPAEMDQGFMKKCDTMCKQGVSVVHSELGFSGKICGHDKERNLYATCAEKSRTAEPISRILSDVRDRCSVRPSRFFGPAQECSVILSCPEGSDSCYAFQSLGSEPNTVTRKDKAFAAKAQDELEKTLEGNRDFIPVHSHPPEDKNDLKRAGITDETGDSFASAGPSPSDCGIRGGISPFSQIMVDRSGYYICSGGTVRATADEDRRFFEISHELTRATHRNPQDAAAHARFAREFEALTGARVIYLPPTATTAEIMRAAREVRAYGLERWRAQERKK